MDFTEGIKALVTGLSTVFLVLILISIIISLLKHVKFIGKKKVQSPAAKAIQTPSVVEEVKNSSNNERGVNETDDLELVAVITAAIAASLNTSVDQLKVTSFRRVSESKGWNIR